MQKSKKKNNASRSGQKPKKQNKNTSRPKTESTAGVPAAYNFLRVTGVPRMTQKPSADGRVIIRHQEYFAPVTGSVTEKTAQYSINPGLESTFPWLSGIARNYESYIWRSLIFEYVPQVGTQTKGRIMIAPDYDARDTAVTTYRRLGSMHGAVMGSIWSPVRLACDSADLHKAKQFYVRVSSPPSWTDVKTYDALTLIVNTGGTVDEATYGDIRVSYVIELITPQVLDDSEMLNSKSISNTAPGLATPFSATTVVAGGLDIAPSSTAQLKFNDVGEYLISGYMNGTSLEGFQPGAKPMD